MTRSCQVGRGPFANQAGPAGVILGQSGGKPKAAPGAAARGQLSRKDLDAPAFNVECREPAPVFRPQTCAESRIRARICRKVPSCRLVALARSLWFGTATASPLAG